MKRVLALFLAAVLATFCLISCSEAIPNNVPLIDGTEPEVTEPEVTEAEVTESEVTEPEVTEPEVTESEVTEPEVTEPEVTEPEVTEPEITEAEVTEPEVTEPEVTEPEVTEPEVTEPEVTESEVTEPEITEAEVTDPEVTEPEVTEPEVTELKVIEPKGTAAEETEPEETEPEVTEPEETEPEETEPKATIPDWLRDALSKGNETESEETEPEVTEPEVTEPEETEPEETEPEVTEPVIDTTDLYDNSDGTATYDRVIVIGVDGGGSFFNNTDTPNIDAIFENGAVTYTMQTSTPSISAQSWGALLHGVTPEAHRLTNSIVSATPFDPESQFPSFFRVVREAYPDAALASFCTWNPINIGIIEDGLGVTKATAGNDADLTEKIIDYLDSNDPKLLFVQFDNVDGAGHGDGYGSDTHLKQITATDGYIGRIYKKLDEEGLLKNTLIIVTADHGGTMAGGHGGSTPEEMNIMFAVAGKTVVNGGTVVSKDEAGNADNAQIRDTAAVVLHAFGLTQPSTWTATVPGDTFVGVDSVTRPEFKIEYEYEHRTHENAATPGENSGEYITDALGKDRVISYITFDGHTADAMGNTTSKDGKLYFVEGYYGDASQMDDGYVEVEDFKPGKNSFSIALWFKTGGVSSDPSLVSNKSWNRGSNPGFILSLREGDVKFNLGNGSDRMDVEYPLPIDYKDGWVHVILSVDREAGTVSFAYDFGEFTTAKIPDSLADASFDGISGLVIGQDGTKNYDQHLSATLDDVLIIDGALTRDDVAALAAYYGIEK